MEPSPSPQQVRPRASASAIKIIIAAAIGILVYIGVQQREKRDAQEKQGREEFNKTRHDLGADMMRDVDKHGAISADTAERTTEKMRGLIDKMATPGGKEDKKAKAVAEVLAELQAKTKPYIALMKQVQSESPLDMTTIRDKADLARRRELGRTMLEMNQYVMAFRDNIESKLREKLVQAGETGGSAEEYVAGFMKSFSKTAAPQHRVRQSDATMAKALITMTDLMEAQWGKWRVESSRIVFDDDDAPRRFHELTAETEKAADERAAAQREVIELQQRR